MGGSSLLFASVVAACCCSAAAAPLKRQRAASLVQLAVSSDASLHLATAKPSLKEYCSGESGKLKPGKKVEADWKNYGTFYPGKVKEVNSDGTVDIKYDDGFTEKNVKPKNLEDVDAPKTGMDPKDDPACELSDTSDKINKALSKVRRILARYVAEKEGKHIKSKADESEARDMDREAAREEARKEARKEALDWSEYFYDRFRSSSYDFSGEKGKEEADKQYEAAKEEAEKEENELIRDVKTEIVEVEREILELETQVEENNRKLRGLDDEPKGRPSVTDDPEEADPSVPTLDDLLEAYRSRLADRRKRLEELRATLREQAEELEERSKDDGKAITVEDIVEAINAIKKDVEEAAKKQAKLEEEGRMDDELANAINQITAKFESLFASISRVQEAEKAAREAEAMAEEAEAKAKKALEEEREKRRRQREKLEAQAKAAAKAAERADAAEAAEAKERARAAAKAVADAVAEEEKHEAAAKAAEREAAAKARQLRAESAEKAQKDALDAAKEARAEVDGVLDKSDKLNSGLTPHGSHWFRYRYEFCYVESCLMIWIVFLMLFWEFMYQRVRKYAQSFVEGHRKMELAEQATMGTLQQNWLDNFADMFVICVLTFITVWVCAKLGVFEYTPMVLDSDKAHLPGDNQEYRRMAIDLCAILFVAIFIYFLIMYSVVRTTHAAIALWQEDIDRTKAVRRQSVMTQVATFALTNIAPNVEYSHLRSYFSKHIHQDEGLDPGMKKEMSESDFPFWLYLRLSVKGTAGLTYEFGVRVWILVVITFFVFLNLHLWAKLGYVRIMIFYLGITTVLLLGMTYMIFEYNAQVVESVESEAMAPAAPLQKQSEGFAIVAFEQVFFDVLNYSMFMMCYGFSRMICQPWMWELHFWNVVYVMCVTLVLIFFFMLAVAPLIPLFAALSSLPPRLNERHQELAVHICEDMPHKAAEA